MGRAIVPAIVALLLLAGCGDGGAASTGAGGAGGGGNPAILTIVTAELPNAIQNGYYYAQVRATGGVAPYTWTLTGMLPTGLTLTQNSSQIAVIDGVPPNYTWSWTGGAAPPPPPPNTDSPLPFDLRITDSLGSTSTRRLITVVDAAAASAVRVRGLTDTTVGSTFSARFNAVGGVASAYSWSVSSGTLPPGLMLSNAVVAEAELAGTAGTAGTYNFDIRANDSLGVVGTATCTITVYAGNYPLTLQPWGASTTINFNLWPTGDFKADLNAIGGTGGYTWRISSGTLPTALALYSDGQQHATLAGTITQIGIFNFQIELADNVGNTATTDVTMNITAMPPP